MGLGGSDANLLIYRCHACLPNQKGPGTPSRTEDPPHSQFTIHNLPLIIDFPMPAAS